MAKKGEQVKVEDTTETLETETPTGETQELEKVKAELATAQEEAERWKKTHQTFQRDVVSKKDDKILELEAQVAHPSSDDDLIQLLIDERRSKVSEFGEADPIIPRLETVIAKRKEAQVKAKQEAYYRQADAVYKSAEEVFGDDVDTLHIIRTYIRAGDFDLAEKKIAKASKPTEPKGKEVEGTEDERFEKRLEEKKREWAEEHGLLTTETGGPSASSMSAQDAMAKYIAGEISAEEAKKRGADFS